MSIVYNGHGGMWSEASTQQNFWARHPCWGLTPFSPLTFLSMAFCVTHLQRCGVVCLYKGHIITKDRPITAVVSVKELAPHC